MHNFQPIGEVARWKIIYGLLVELDVDAVISYEELGDALGLHPERERNVIQLAMRRAAKELLHQNRRAVEAKRGVGYRVVAAEEHLRLAGNFQRKAGRSLVRGKDTITHADLTKLDPTAQAAFGVVAQAFSQLISVQRYLDVRQKGLEQRLIEQEQATTGRFQTLEERIEKLESE